MYAYITSTLGRREVVSDRPSAQGKAIQYSLKRKGGSGKAMAKYYREHDKVPKGNSHNMQNLVHGDFSYNFQVMFNQHIVKQMVNYNEVIRHKCTLQTTKGLSSNVMENFNALFSFLRHNP